MGNQCFPTKNKKPSEPPSDQPSTSLDPASSSNTTSVTPVLDHSTPNILDVYKMGDKLGKGDFGTTYLCTEMATGNQYACKSISKDILLTEGDREDVRREIQIMRHLSGHKNIAAIRGEYEDTEHVHIVMDLCAGGKLLDRVLARKGYSEKKAAEIFKIIAGVVNECHRKGVMLRNLKLDNFLFANKDDDLSLKAIDFGLSVFFEPGQVFKEVVGNLLYVAPEVFGNNYGPQADVWSAGVALYILLSGGPPFYAEKLEDVPAKIRTGGLDLESSPWPYISESAKQLIGGMLCHSPSERYTSHRVLYHPWVCNDGVAPDRALNPVVLSRLQNFSALNKSKALSVIAERLSEEEIVVLRETLKAMDTENNGTITFDELQEGLRSAGATLMESEIRNLKQADGRIDYAKLIAEMQKGGNAVLGRRAMRTLKLRIHDVPSAD